MGTDTTPGELYALQLIWDRFAEQATWPRFQDIDRTVYRATNESLQALLEGQRPQRVIFDPYGQKDTKVALTPLGIQSCQNTENDLRSVLNAVRWCVTLERDTDDETSLSGITPQRLAKGLREQDPAQRLDNDRLDRTFGILVSEGIVGMHARPTSSSPRWTFGIDDRVRRFKDVKTVDDLIAVTARPSSPRILTGTLADPTRGAQASTGSTGVGVFVLMPFGPKWSARVYESICDGCAAGTGGTAIVERADEITEAGSITQQIQQRIRQADIVIADLTGTNGNVMYELGYADALRKYVIPLNQDVESTPFDVSVHRQIAYELHELPALSERVRAFVETALAAREA